MLICNQTKWYGLYYIIIFVCVLKSVTCCVLVDSSLVGYIPVCHASKSSMQQVTIFTHSFTVSFTCLAIFIIVPWDCDKRLWYSVLQVLRW